MEFKDFIKPSIEGGFIKLFLTFTFLMLISGFSFYTGAIIEGVSFVTFINFLFAFLISRESRTTKEHKR